MKKIFLIDHEILEFNKTYGWNLIGIHQKEDAILSDHDYFFFHDDLFDRVQATQQDRNILWKFVSNEPN